MKYYQFLMMAALTVANSPFLIFAQEALPATDIYLLDITTDKKGKLHFENPFKISKNEGYDNQPWFYPDGTALLYASVRDSLSHDTLKTDIYKFNISDSKTSVVIRTPFTAEYSPMILPSKLGISVVRVLEDDTTQVLAKCDDKTDECQVLIPKMNKVGYYMWIDANRAALFVLGDPATLQVATVSTGEVKIIAEDVGRCIQKVPGKNVQIAFVDKSSNPWKIKTYDAKSGKISTVVSTLEDQEDFCYMPDGSLLMGSGSELYQYIPPMAVPAAGTKTTSSSSKDDDKDKSKSKTKSIEWDMIFDFDETPVEYFYRIAVSPKGNKIAMVIYPEDKP